MIPTPQEVRAAREKWLQDRVQELLKSVRTCLLLPPSAYEWKWRVPDGTSAAALKAVIAELTRKGWSVTEAGAHGDTEYLLIEVV